MSLSIKIDWEELRELEFDDFVNATFTSIGSKLSFPAIAFVINNGTDRVLYFSNDGINKKWVLPSGGYQIIDIQTNHGISNAAAAPAGSKFYAMSKTTVPTTGSASVSVMYLSKS